MKITLVYGAVTGADYGLLSAIKYIRKTFEELGESLSDINLIHEDIPYYDGETSSTMKKLVSALKNSDGIIFAFTTNLFAPTACMQNFFEYLSYKTFGECLRDKNLFVITSSRAGGEADALNYAGKLIRSFGGNDAVRLGLTQNLLKDLEQNPNISESIEKYAEDYYRIIRQNRKFILPSDAFLVSGKTPEIFDEDFETLMDYDKKEEMSLDAIEEKYKFNEFTEKQEEDIREITQFFAGKYKEDLNITPNSNHINNMGLVAKTPPPPRLKTVRQMTQSLVHYFQPQLSAGLTAVVQINVFGGEIFEGYLTIVNSECEYAEGSAETPDLTIICDSNIWVEILKGKFSAQKAFMIGQLKVRGNFVLLTKFDQIFKPQT
jgi:putative sterol carrier protein/NAD(P)H-dependent FMN reductase